MECNSLALQGGSWCCFQLWLCIAFFHSSPPLPTRYCFEQPFYEVSSPPAVHFCHLCCFQLWLLRSSFTHHPPPAILNAITISILILNLHSQYIRYKINIQYIQFGFTQTPWFFVSNKIRCMTCDLYCIEPCDFCHSPTFKKMTTRSASTKCTFLGRFCAS